jgi:heme-degrading monooxygenase HmoA
MHARVRSYRIKEGQVPERVKHGRETSVKGFKGQKGFGGVLILVDPASHKNMTVGLWETEADMQASDRQEAVTSQAAHRRHASGDVTTEHFEVRDRGGEPGGFVRAYTYQIAPGQIEERMRHSRDVAVPYWKAQPGYTGHMVLIDPANHKNVTLGFFATEADMLAAEANSEGKALPPHQVGTPTVEHFEVGHTE